MSNAALMYDSWTSRLGSAAAPDVMTCGFCSSTEQSDHSLHLQQFRSPTGHHLRLTYGFRVYQPVGGLRGSSPGAIVKCGLASFVTINPKVQMLCADGNYQRPKCMYLGLDYIVTMLAG